jgi:hypothetical protein
MQDWVLINIHHSHIATEVDTIERDRHLVETSLIQFWWTTHDEVWTNILSM